MYEIFTTNIKMEQHKYQRMEHKEHIYKLPDTYIGSIEFHSEEIFIKTDSDNFEKKKINYVPGFYKIFDEILVNSLDHRQRDISVKNIKVNISYGQSGISIYNDGEGIDICLYDEEKQIYIPELLFSHLLTSTNYNQTEKKTTGGKNGYGSKLTCIFSKSFMNFSLDMYRLNPKDIAFKMG